MFIERPPLTTSKLRRSAMSTSRSYGAWIHLLISIYKHCAPTELEISSHTLVALLNDFDGGAVFEFLTFRRQGDALAFAQAVGDLDFIAGALAELHLFLSQGVAVDNEKFINAIDVQQRVLRHEQRARDVARRDRRLDEEAWLE